MRGGEAGGGKYSLCANFSVSSIYCRDKYSGEIFKPQTHKSYLTQARCRTSKGGSGGKRESVKANKSEEWRMKEEEGGSVREEGKNSML